MNTGIRGSSMSRHVCGSLGSIGTAFGVPDPKKVPSAAPLKGWKGDATHPKAPAGGGGPGGFVTPGVEKSDHKATRLLALDSSSIALAATGGGQKAPPVTTPRTKPVVTRKSKTEDIDVKVEVLADTTSSDPLMQGAKTGFDSTGVAVVTPGYMTMKKKGKNIVTEISGVLELKGTIFIQTTYGPGAKPTIGSMYGRGTTPKDKKNGNTSLGFHEFCHQRDFLRFLASNALPKYSGKVGQTEAAFQKAAQLFQKALKKYWAEMNKYTVRRTDEVGYKKSKCLRAGKC
jgi:hypothetical protein